MNQEQVRYPRMRYFLGAVLMALTLSPQAALAATRVLLIGIDDYQADSISDLRGCGNDVALMRSTLIDKFSVEPDNIQTLQDAQATRAGILAAIQDHLIAKAERDDVVILHYSGHGSQMRDASGDEIDGFDETLVPHDSRTPGVFDISDDEINGLLQQLTAKTRHVTFILDSCHSGSGTRAGNTTRRIPADTRPPPKPPAFALGTRGSGEGAADFRLNGADYVLISGCLATELSNEGLFEGGRQGVMTWFLSQALRAAGPDATYASIMDDVSLEVNSRYASQHPQIEGPGRDLRVFGVERIQVTPTVLIDAVEGERLRLAAGRVYGLSEGAELDVYAPGTTDFEASAPLARIELIEVRDFDATAKVISGGPVVTHAKALLETLQFGADRVRVYLRDIEAQTASKLREAVDKLAAARRVDSEQDAQLIVAQEDRQLRIRTGDLSLAAPPVAVAAPDAVPRVVDQIKDLSHWLHVMGLKNPTGGIRLGFDIRRADDPPGTPLSTRVAPGTRLTYRVHNRDAVPLYVYVLDLSSDGSIALLYPQVGGAQEILPAGKVLERTIETFVPEDRSGVMDVFKVIATTRPIDPAVFPQGALKRAAPAQFDDPLAQFLAQSLRATRGSRPVQVKSWVTAQQRVDIRHPGLRTAGFALHFDAPRQADALPVQFGQSRSTCDAKAGTDVERCFQARQAGVDGTEWEFVQAKASRGEAETLMSVGAAFDEAYRIQAQLPGAVRVEPLLEVETTDTVDERGIDKRDIGSDDSHDARARADDQWHLKQIRGAAAWEKLRAKRGVAAGAEADGLLIAHIDTGYREHPETWDEVNGKRPIDPSRGYDYYAGDDDPLDPLLEDRSTDNPGHGTASGSIIVSPGDCQLAGAAGCVHGVARGAQLIPLRVHRTVSQFNTSNMSRAIREVAEGGIDGQPRLVSIAMGGPPTLSMWKAVKLAERNGVLVVAAAGNYVRIVVWPARFQSTIAAGASGVTCRPWKDSSRGSKVDISAPGESVWRATLNSDHDYINGMGKGTTFATGNTSGAAALWLAYHADDPAFEALRAQGRVTQAFRAALQQSAWQPSALATDNPPGTHCVDGEWDATRHGAGLLDAAALLEVPLPGATRGDHPAAELDDLPLFSSLYPDGTEPERIRADYRALFGATRDAEPRSLEPYETEILYHYTQDAAVQRSLEALVEGQRGDEPYSRVRAALQRQDLSTRLRGLLAE